MIKRLHSLIQSNIIFLTNLIAFLTASGLIVLQTMRQMGGPRMSTDFVSWALSSMAPIFGIGHPYVDYWGINPPGLLMMTSAWGVLVGSSLQSFHLLFLVCISLISYFSWKILQKSFQPVLGLTLFGIYCILFFNGTVQSLFFPSEINGLVCTMAALWLLLGNKLTASRLFWIHFLFILASQMKEVFAFQGLAVLPIALAALHEGGKKSTDYLKPAILGSVAAVALCAGYLMLNGALSEYRSITSYKSTQFSVSDLEKVGSRAYRTLQFPKDRFFYARYQFPALLFLGVVASLAWITLASKSSSTNSSKKDGEWSLTIKFKPHHRIYAILICFWIGSIIGYAFQGRYGNKYDLEPLLATIIMTAIVIKIIFAALASGLDKYQRGRWLPVINLFGFMVTVFLLLPHKSFLIEPVVMARAYSPLLHWRLWNNLDSHEAVALEKRIDQRLAPEDCITSVYGWGVGDAYYYSRRSSCSKHFLLNIMPKTDYQAYANALISNPPKAIVYTIEGADLDTSKFEREVFNFSRVLSACYIQDIDFPKLHWLSVPEEQAADCLGLGLPLPSPSLNDTIN